MGVWDFYFRFLDLDSLFGIPGLGFLVLDSWFVFPGLGFLGLDSCVWIPEFGFLGLDSWAWIKTGQKPVIQRPKLQIMT